MKLLSILFILVFCLSAFGQTKPPAQPSDANQISIQLQKQKQEAQAERRELLKKYTLDYIEVKKLDAVINSIDVQLGLLSVSQPTKSELTKAEAEIFGKLELTELLAINCGYDPTKPECANHRQAIADVYAEVSRSPRLLRLLAARAISIYEGNRSAAKSVSQAVQLADEQNAALIRVLVAQNQRIIELLEKLTKGIK